MCDNFVQKYVANSSRFVHQVVTHIRYSELLMAK
jgi:hypothetical protein